METLALFFFERGTMAKEKRLTAKCRRCGKTYEVSNKNGWIIFKKNCNPDSVILDLCGECVMDFDDFVRRRNG